MTDEQLRELHKERAAGKLFNGPQGACSRCMQPYPCTVIALLDRLEAAERRAERAVAALQLIRTTQGKVCDEYEICEHAACNSSYSSWAYADKAIADVARTSGGASAAIIRRGRSVISWGGGVE